MFGVVFGVGGEVKFDDELLFHFLAQRKETEIENRTN